MKNYVEKNFNAMSLKKTDLQQIGGYVAINDEGLTEKGKQDLSMNDESGFSTISYIDSQDSEYVADYNAIDYNSYYFDEIEWQDFVSNLMNYKKYNHFLVVLFNSRWTGASGVKIFDDYYKCFQRDYDCSMYVVGSSVKGKALTLKEYHHDVPTGHNSVIVGLTDMEFEKLYNKQYDINNLIEYGKKYINNFDEEKKVGV